MRIQFIGAVHEVTGSCTLLTVNGRYYLVDCGMEQGLDVYQNISLPVSPSSIEAVFLTHAHIDHSGMLPRLYKDGFRGSIYATEATTDLCKIMLMDSAHIQVAEAQWRTRKAERAGKPACSPMYDLDDAAGCLKLFRPCLYNQIIWVAEGIELRFTDIGHLLGSACIELQLTEANVSRKIVFSGDVGNTHQPIIRDPQPVAETDYLVIESTYGDRLHDPAVNAITDLVDCLQRAFDRGGSVIIPSFAVGRTQELLYALREIKQKNMVTGHDHFRVYVDSPLAVEATAIFMQCDQSCFDEETLGLIRSGQNPIWFDDIRLCISSEESKAINEDLSPKVIISASGMCEAGRIRHHLKHSLWRPSNIILFVGYQAEGSLGRALLNGAKSARLFGEEIVVRAEICSLHGTSGHADQQGLLNWVMAFQKKPQMIFVNHGDTESCEAFKTLLCKTCGFHAEAPYSGAEYDLATGQMTVFADAKPIVHPQQNKAQTRADVIYQDLVQSAEALLDLAKQFRGHSNKDNSKLTDQIRNLIEKWKD